MVCKEDVVSWFKELESYKRIDAMCTLLNMCLPFELRFIGTYLEELGKRDFQELRGAELRANNPAELAADIVGVNTDARNRRKMALYVSLLRSCNYACATTLYNVMVGLEQTGLLAGLYGDPLEELLLLYTMALHHPAFTFDQRSHFGEILDKLKVEDQRLHYAEAQMHVNIVPNMTPNLSVPPPNLGPAHGLVYVKGPGMQVAPPTNEQINELGNTPSPHANTAMSSAGLLAGLSEMSGLHGPHTPHPVYNMADYMVGQTPWPTGLIMPTLNQPLEILNYPPPSPLVSNPSTPNDSRASSPARMSVVGGVGGVSVVGGAGTSRRRRPSSEATPPPQPPDMSVVPLLAATFNTLTISEMRHMEDERLRELGVPPNAVAQLRSVEKLNGVRAASGTSGGLRGGGVGGNLSSDSSSAGSPPPRAPPPHYPYLPAPTHYRRPYTTTYTPSPGPPAYRQATPAPSFTNGEPAPLYPTGAGTYAYAPVAYPSGPTLAPPKLSCWNCGGSGHAGHDCKEPSMEEVTRAGGYQLDYSAAPPDIHDK